MSLLLKIVLFVVALAGAPLGYIFYEAALSPNDWHFLGGAPTNWRDAGFHGAPGPIIGAGLPVLVFVAAAAYWLRRRSRA